MLSFEIGLKKELKKGIFTMDSYLAQLRQIKKMGGMEGIMSMLPGVNKIKDKNSFFYCLVSVD